MMKKNGFTLAEVLITLAIIGVVATLTLPSLMTNTAEQQAITSFKKIMNTLNEAGQMNSALEGFDYSISTRGDNISERIEDGTESLVSLFNERLQVSSEASGGYGEGAHCTGDPVLVLRDGTAICLGGEDAHDEENGGFWKIWVDTNAQKGPNEESTCGENDEGCTTKADRHIHDQFPVTLNRGIAVPGHWTAYEQEGSEGPDLAARYAMGVGKRAQAGEGGD